MSKAYVRFCWSTTSLLDPTFFLKQKTPLEMDEQFLTKSFWILTFDRNSEGEPFLVRLLASVFGYLEESHTNTNEGGTFLLH